MVRQHQTVLDERGPFYVLDLPEGGSPTTIAPDARVDLLAAFSSDMPIAVEIRPGSGEQFTSYAKEHPDRNILVFEAWYVGVARCVTNAMRKGVTNVRIVEIDAAQALPAIFAGPGAPQADEPWTFFPDLWRKSRHRKHRLIAGPFIAEAAEILEIGDLRRFATGWNDYAWQIRGELEASDSFANLHAGERPDPNDHGPTRGGFAPRWDERVMTRFERQGVKAGRMIHDLTFRRD